MAETTETAAKPEKKPAFAHPAIKVTKKELEIALGKQPRDVVPEGKEARANPTLDFLLAGKGIVAKEYTIDDKTKKPVETGVLKTGKEALKYVHKAFGEKVQYRTMYVDQKKANKELGDAAIAAAPGREQAARIRAQAGKRAESKKGMER